MIRVRYLILAILLAVILLVLVLASGCEYRKPVFERFPMENPYPPLEAQDIAYLDEHFDLGSFMDGAESSGDAAIADAILAWQRSRMFLALDGDFSDLSYPMRWNQVLPGIYPVKRMIRERQHEDPDDGGRLKIYGVCWDYAAIFIAIAEAYEVEVRLNAYRIYLSDQSWFEGTNRNEGADLGMSPQESDALCETLGDLGYAFPEYLLNDAMRETFIHYRPEVYLDGEWVAYDATGPDGDFIVDGNYPDPVGWDEFADPSLAIR